MLLTSSFLCRDQKYVIFNIFRNGKKCIYLWGYNARSKEFAWHISDWAPAQLETRPGGLLTWSPQPLLGLRHSEGLVAWCDVMVCGRAVHGLVCVCPSSCSAAWCGNPARKGACCISSGCSSCCSICSSPNTTYCSSCHCTSWIHTVSTILCYTSRLKDMPHVSRKHQNACFLMRKCNLY